MSTSSRRRTHPKRKAVMPAYSYNETDHRAMILEQARKHPEACVHVVDLPYRLCCPAMHTPGNARIWADDDGALQGWAAWLLPFGTLDVGGQPDNQADLVPEMLRWAAERLEEFARERGAEQTAWGMARDRDAARVALLEAHGFRRHGWHHVRMERSLEEPIPETVVPEGYRLRPLAGAIEVEAYVALHRAAFGTDNMTVEWRERILHAPEYMPGLDLVAVGPGGGLTAFCVGWMGGPDTHTGERRAQIEPMGVHPDHQRRGLSRALLSETLRRMRAEGATHAQVSADSGDAAQSAYRSAGFRPVEREYGYGRTFR